MVVWKYKLFLASAFVTIISIVAVMHFISFDNVLDRLFRVDFFVLSVAVLLYALSLFFRVLRICILSSFNVSFGTLVDVVAKYSVANYFLPLKIGEASMPIMLKRGGLSASRAVWVWLWSRVLDISVVIVFGVVVYGLSFSMFQNVNFFWFLLLAFVGIMLIGLLIRISKTVKRFLESGVEMISSLNIWKLTFLLAMTVASWVSVYLMYSLVFSSVGYSVEVAVCVMALLVMAPISFLPVNSIAGVGGFQAAWVAVLVGAGWSGDVALQASVTVHILVSVLVLFVGIFMSLLSGRALRF